MERNEWDQFLIPYNQAVSELIVKFQSIISEYREKGFKLYNIASGGLNNGEYLAVKCVVTDKKFNKTTNMKKFLIFIGGFVAGILATIFALYVYSIANKPNDGLLGLTIFEEKGECITTTSKNKSSEIDIFQVIAPNAALATIKYYSDEKNLGSD